MIFSHSSFPIPRFSNTQALCAVVAKKYFIQYSARTELLYCLLNKPITLWVDVSLHIEVIFVIVPSLTS